MNTKLQQKRLYTRETTTSSDYEIQQKSFIPAPPLSPLWNLYNVPFFV